METKGPMVIMHGGVNHITDEPTAFRVDWDGAVMHRFDEGQMNSIRDYICTEMLNLNSSVGSLCIAVEDLLKELKDANS